MLTCIQNLGSNDLLNLNVIGSISTKTIANCFSHAGFHDLLIIYSDDDDGYENDISLAQLARNPRPTLSTIEVEEFVKSIRHTQ